MDEKCLCEQTEVLLFPKLDNGLKRRGRKDNKVSL